MIAGLSVEEYYRRYREKNKDKVAEQQKRYREKNKDKVAEQQKRYREKNKDKVAEQQKRYYEKNKDKVAEQQKRYYKKNKDKYRRYYEKNKDKVAERRKHVSPSVAIDDFFKHFTRARFHSIEELEQTLLNYSKAACSIEGNCDILGVLRKDKRYLEIKTAVKK